MDRRSSKLTEAWWLAWRAYLIACMLFLGFVSVDAKPRPAACRVSPLWIDDTGLRSSIYGDLGTFNVSGEEGITVRSYRDNDTSLVVTAAVRFDYDYSKRPQRPYQVWLAITVSDVEQKKVFEHVNSSEAFTRDKKGWNLSVRKSVKVQDKLFMYALTCYQVNK